MADDKNADDKGAEDEELMEGSEKKKINTKFLIIGAIVFLVLILAVLGAVVLFSGGDEDPANVEAGKDPALETVSPEGAERQKEPLPEPDLSPEELALLFIPVEEQVYNLNTGGEGNSFLRIQIILEVDRESYRADIEAKMPRILDELNTYMRELRPDDLDGSAGLFRLKEELLMRINQSVAPSRVKDVLFQEFLIQG